MSWRVTAFALAVGLAIVPDALSSPTSPTPGAFELLERVRQAYADLETYHDLGEIETTTGPAGHEQTTLRFFETAATARDGFFWRTHGETETGFEERVFWRQGGDAFVYSSFYQQYKPVNSLVAELAHAWGQGSYEALIVPLLLAGASDALADPAAAAVAGSEPCGEHACWVLSLTRLAGAIEYQLHVDQQSLMIREVVVSIASPASTGPPDETPDLGRRTLADRLTIQVRHHPTTTVPIPFAPPAEAHRVAQWQPPSAEGPAVDSLPMTTFGEEITVSLLTVVTRIVDSTGEPIRDLEPEDLVVRVGRAETPVVGLEWFSSFQTQTDSAKPALPVADTQSGAIPQIRLDEPASMLPPATGGKLVVFFLQISFEPSRVAGHLKILPDVENLLNDLHPSDRVAIVSYDSHLKLWQDFNGDRQKTFDVLKRAISFGTPAARRSLGTSLLEHFDTQAAADAATPEVALRVTAEALSRLPGDKDMIYLGWGLGRYGAGGVRMTADYAPAVRALDRARATVFVLDVSQADFHSLEVGLQNVAAGTGGTYDRTLHFSSQAVKRLARTITGHYLVTIDRSGVTGARGRLAIRLREGKGRVLFKPMTLG